MKYSYYTNTTSRKNRGQYIQIYDHPSHHGLHRNDDELEDRSLQLHLMGRSVWWGVGLVAVVVCVAIATSSSSPSTGSSLSAALQYNLQQQQQRQQQQQHETKGGKHTIPTLLSVVNHETGDYLWALKNPLYDQLQRAMIVPYDAAIHRTNAEQTIVMELPRLSLDRTEMNVLDPLTLSWTMGLDHLGDTVLKDDDVIALYCGSSGAEDDPVVALAHPHSQYHWTRFLDAATIAQAKATSQKHSRDNHYHEEQWHFPSFPVQRHEVCQFVLLKKTYQRNRKSKDVYVILGTSNPLEITSARTVPMGIHLALGDSPSEMLVQFIGGGDNDLHVHNEGTSVAQYSKQGDKSVHKASGTSHTYTVEDMCEAPANITEAGKFQSPGMIHVVRLTGLEPNSVYEYKVGLTHGQGITWSDTFSFLSAPAVRADAAPFSYLVYGDQGCPAVGWGDGGKWVAAMTAREVLTPKDKNLPVRAIHHFGDLSYARGAGHIWDAWFNMIAPFSAKVPLMVAVGNHEYDHMSGGANGKDPSGLLVDDGYRPLWGNFRNDSGGECGVPTANHFMMPNSTNSNKVFWYSYDFGSVHTTVISTEHDLAPGSTQHGWLLADLRSVNRQKTPWLVIEGHRPLYESQMNWEDNAVGIARRFELDDVLKDYKVDLVLSGHYHSYLRTCDGLYNSQCNSAGSPIHITVGTSGATLTDAETYPNHWTDKLIVEFGYGRITVTNASAMLFEFVKAGDTNDTSAGEVQDQVWIIRDR